MNESRVTFWLVNCPCGRRMLFFNRSESVGVSKEHIELTIKTSFEMAREFIDSRHRKCCRCGQKISKPEAVRQYVDGRRVEVAGGGGNNVQ